MSDIHLLCAPHFIQTNLRDLGDCERLKKSGCNGYLTLQRKIYIHHSRARKGSYFSKRQATELLPRGITCRAQQPAIHQMPVLGVQKKKKKNGFMSEIKCCWFVWLRGRATNRHTTVSSFEDPQLLTCQTYEGFQKRLFTPNTFHLSCMDALFFCERFCAVCPVELKHP